MSDVIIKMKHPQRDMSRKHVNIRPSHFARLRNVYTDRIESRHEVQFR